VFNLAWPQQFTLEELLRQVETALGIEQRQPFQSDEDADNMYLYPTVCDRISAHYYFLLRQRCEVL